MGRRRIQSTSKALSVVSIPKLPDDERSRLLSIDSWGQVAEWRSAQADMTVSAYIFKGALPALNAAYNQDNVPFKVQWAGVSGLGIALAGRPQLTPMTVILAVRNAIKVNKKDYFEQKPKTF